MIVKKYEIDRFEFENVEKGYDQKNKYCLVFNKSEDIFFEYPYSPVQGRHYRNNEELDVLKRIPDSEVSARLESSRTSNVNNNIKKVKSSTNDAQTKLHNIWKEEFSDRKLPPVEDAKQMIISAEEDPEQDLGALLTEYYVKLDKI